MPQPITAKPILPEPTTDLYPVPQPGGSVCYASQREAAGMLTELAASGIGWAITECPQVLALGAAAAIGLWLLTRDDGPKGRRK